MNISSSDQYLPLPFLRGNYRYTLAVGNLTVNAVLQFQPVAAGAWYDYVGSEMLIAGGATSGVAQVTALNCPMRLAFASAPGSAYHVSTAYEVYPHN